MKRFRDILKEGHDSYPADDMTIKELRIALNSAEHILDMIEEGAMVQRWQISAIVKASEELASVCTSMRADHDENDEGEDEAHEYHFQMNFEEAQLDEAESWEAGYNRRVVKTAKPEHKEKFTIGE